MDPALGPELQATCPELARRWKTPLRAKARAGVLQAWQYVVARNAEGLLPQPDRWTANGKIVSCVPADDAGTAWTPLRVGDEITLGHAFKHVAHTAVYIGDGQCVDYAAMSGIARVRSLSMYFGLGYVCVRVKTPACASAAIRLEHARRACSACGVYRVPMPWWRFNCETWTSLVLYGEGVTVSFPHRTLQYSTNIFFVVLFVLVAALVAVAVISRSRRT